MNALEQLTAKLRGLAAKPPKVEGKVHVRLPIRNLPLTDSQGRRRPIVRQSIMEQQMAVEQARGRSVEQARQQVVAQIREDLA